MIDPEEFYSHIMPYAPGCSAPMANQAIVAAAREFCQRTRLWRSADSFELTEDCNVVCAPEGADLYEIEFASFNGQTLEPIGYGELNRDMPNWRTADGQPKWISQVEHDSVIVAPYSAGTLELGLLLVPSEDAEQLPDFLAKHYRQVIAWGALREIMLVPNQSFTSPDSAALYGARFEQKVDSLFNRTIKGQQRAPARTRPSYF